MTSIDVLVDAFDRIRGTVHQVVDGLGPDQLAFRVEREANTIAWLIWHLTRVQDDHVSEPARSEQVWTSQGWVERFGLSLPAADTGFGHFSDDVAALRDIPGEALAGYHDAVHERTTHFVQRLTDTDLARIVDASWDPPVSLGVRLVSVISDGLQHAGQAAFVRGIVQRTHRP